MLKKLAQSNAPAAAVLIRVAVGIVFLSEGLQKFLFAEALGTGRFERIGIPSPEILAPFVGGVEILCGALILLGLLTRLAALTLVLNISVAILSTKIPILLGHGFWTFTLTKLPRYGLLAMLHEARTDLCMFLGGLYLVIVGAGKWSLDARIAREGNRQQNQKTPNPKP